MNSMQHVRHPSPDELADSLYGQLFRGITLDAEHELRARRLLRQSACEEYGIHPCIAGAHPRVLQIVDEREQLLLPLLQSEAARRSFSTNAAAVRERYSREALRMRDD